MYFVKKVHIYAKKRAIKRKPVLKNVSISRWVVIGHVGVETMLIISLVTHHPLFLSWL